ncbi:MAG: YggS family pyridoxal phosphate-dependent enzyme [Microcoleaceae cyanobacterium]
MTDAITQHINQIRADLPPKVRLIAVTKTVSVEAMRAAYQAGIRDFGENRVQEAQEKQTQLQDLVDIRWHLIGHLQSNKAVKAIELFDWIHSVDSLKLAKRLDRLAQELTRSPQVCLQVKTLPDPDKFGWSENELLRDLPQLNELQHIKIKGLMTILPQGLEQSETKQAFERTRTLSEQIRQQNWSQIQMQELSMGMSGDYPLAIGSGATMIRLGQIIFGARSV